MAIRMTDVWREGLRYEPSERWVRAYKGGELVVDTHRPVVVWREGKTVPQYVFHAEDVNGSDRHSICPYKGVASYYTVGGNKDIAWYYPDPLPGVERIKDLVAFWNERVDVLDNAE